MLKWQRVVKIIIDKKIAEVKHFNEIGFLQGKKCSEREVPEKMIIVERGLPVRSFRDGRFLSEN